MCNIPIKKHDILRQQNLHETNVNVIPYLSMYGSVKIMH